MQHKSRVPYCKLNSHAKMIKPEPSHTTNQTIKPTSDDMRTPRLFLTIHWAHTIDVYLLALKGETSVMQGYQANPLCNYMRPFRAAKAHQGVHWNGSHDILFRKLSHHAWIGNACELRPDAKPINTTPPSLAHGWPHLNTAQGWVMLNPFSFDWLIVVLFWVLGFLRRNSITTIKIKHFIDII